MLQTVLSHEANMKTLDRAVSTFWTKAQNSRLLPGTSLQVEPCRLANQVVSMNDERAFIEPGTYRCFVFLCVPTIYHEKLLI